MTAREAIRQGYRIRRTQVSVLCSGCGRVWIQPGLWLVNDLVIPRARRTYCGRCLPDVRRVLARAAGGAE